MPEDFDFDDDIDRRNRRGIIILIALLVIGLAALGLVAWAKMSKPHMSGRLLLIPAFASSGPWPARNRTVAIRLYGIRPEPSAA